MFSHFVDIVFYCHLWLSRLFNAGSHVPWPKQNTKEGAYVCSMTKNTFLCLEEFWGQPQGQNYFPSPFSNHVRFTPWLLYTASHYIHPTENWLSARCLTSVNWVSILTSAIDSTKKTTDKKEEVKWERPEKRFPPFFPVDQLHLHMSTSFPNATFWHLLLIFMLFGFAIIFALIFIILGSHLGLILQRLNFPYPGQHLPALRLACPRLLGSCDLLLSSPGISLHLGPDVTSDLCSHLLEGFWHVKNSQV